MLQRGKRAEGPEGSPKPQNGSGLGAQTCPGGHSSLPTLNPSWAGVSSHNHCRPAPGRRAPCHPWPQDPQCPTVSHSVPHADSPAPAHAEPQHKARGNQTHPHLAKPSGDPSPPLPPCWWGSGGALVGLWWDGWGTWMSHSQGMMGSEGRAAMQWRQMGGLSG